MILRRVIEHVREQNWTAVGIDFVTVVVGVLVGLAQHPRDVVALALNAPGEFCQ